MSYDEATNWREEITRDLADYGIDALSPMTGKDFLRYREEVLLQTYSDCLTTSAAGIVLRDFNWLDRSDVVLANLQGAERVSIGSVAEIARAYTKGIPIVCVMDETDIHNHPFVAELCDIVTQDMEAAIEFLGDMKID